MTPQQRTPSTIDQAQTATPTPHPPPAPHVREVQARVFDQRPAVAPDGWIAEPIGYWAGRPSEVVYDPRRHKVAVITGSMPEASVHPLEAAGWNEQSSDGRRSLWVQDKLSAARAALDRLDHAAPAAGRTGPDIGGGDGAAPTPPGAELAL